MRRILVLPLLLFPVAGFAQPESVAVTAAEDFLAGAWTIAMPAEGPSRQGLKAGFGPMRDAFCRLEGPTERLRAHCLNLDGAGLVTRKGKTIHMVWGGMARRVSIEATMTSLHAFRGSFTVRLFGFSFRAPEPVRASRRPHLENVPDVGAKSLLLSGLLARPSAAPKGAVLPPGKELGAVLRLIHMGRMPDRADVYAVQYASASRLCAIRQRGDGAVDLLRCV